MSDMPSVLARLQSAFDRIALLPVEHRPQALSELEASAPEVAGRVRALLQQDAAFGPEDAWHDGPPEATPSLPKIPGYRLLNLVGRGGMGRVYRAVQIEDKQQVVRALKLLAGEHSRPQLRQRFEAECRVLAELDHPGIARYIASGRSDEGLPFAVMEYIEGEPIDRWCDQRNLRLTERVSLVRQLLSAVQHAHQRLIVHRDIKPNNVLVDKNGRVILVDFGIAKRLSGEQTDELTATADRFLSVLSAAPEQLAGQAASTATDGYSVGLLLYQLLCGRDPFSDAQQPCPIRYQQRVLDTPAPTMASRLSADDSRLAAARGLSSPAELKRALAGDLTRVVLRCLRKAPSERYADAGSLDRDLRAVIEGWPISERESEPVYRLRKFVARHRIGVGLAGAATLLLLAMLSTALAQRARALHERDRAEAVVQVLIESFAAANPLGVDGGAIRVGEVLDASLPMLADLRPAQPELFTTLAATMAEVELSAGRPRQALQLLDDAFALNPLTSTQGGQPLSRLRLLEARARLEAGLLDGLQEKLQRLPDTPLRLRVNKELLLGRLSYLQSDMDQAIVHLQKARSAAADLPSDDTLALEANLYLAQAWRLNDHEATAIQVLDDTLQQLRQRFHADHPRVLITQLRRLEMISGAPQPLLEQTEQLLQRIGHVFGTSSAPYARTLGLRAQLQRRAGQAEQSIASNAAAWQAWSAATHAGHPNTLRSLFNLAFSKSRNSHPTSEVDALFERLFVDARNGAELSPAIVNYWHISYIEFLAQRGECPRAAQMAAERFSTLDNNALNPPSRRLLTTVLSELDQQCGCTREPSGNSCASLEAVSTSLQALGKQS